MSKVIGIDISMQTFDAFGINKCGKKTYLKPKNEADGFKRILSEYGKDNIYVMEATGPYYIKLANFLHSKGAVVSVVNPLVIKRFSQMNLQRAKTDKKDAQTIYNFGIINELKSWSPPKAEVIQMQQMLTSIELVNKQITALKNQFGAYTKGLIFDTSVKQILESLICELKCKKEQLEERLDFIAKAHFTNNYQLLQSIPGIGPKAAAILIAITNNFENFMNYKQLIAYVGTSPRIFQSGTSVRGKGHICKMGKSQVRKQMYMSSWSAKFHNEACVEMYQRLAEKGKPERVIKIAIVNKLLKQAFAIVKSGNFYNKEFISKRIVA